MARKSATLIGLMIGKTAHEVNDLLEEIGFQTRTGPFTLQGSQLWELTEEGKQYGEYSSNYPIIIWDESVAYLIGDPNEHAKRIENILNGND